MKSKRLLRFVPVIVIPFAILLFAACGLGKTPKTNSAGDALQAASDLNDSTQEGTGSITLPPIPTSGPFYEQGIPRRIEFDTLIPDRPRVDIITYTVKAGDNLFVIADQFGLKPETVLWGNYDILRDNPQFLKEGQKLRILPTDGVLYQWAENDKLDVVARFFKVDPQSIIDWPGNHLKSDDLLETPVPISISVGQNLIIPGGQRELRDWGPPPITRDNPAAAAYYGAGYCGKVYEGAIGLGFFIWPTTATYLSGYDYSPTIHPGIDIAGKLGNPVYASDTGVIVFAGWSQYGYGNLVVIDHGNGWQSAYAHLDSVNVYCGESVPQASVIGLLGTTGNSTGPHLHFELRNEVYGKVNPWDFVSP